MFLGVHVATKKVLKEEQLRTGKTVQSRATPELSRQTSNEHTKHGAHMTYIQATKATFKYRLLDSHINTDVNNWNSQHIQISNILH